MGKTVSPSIHDLFGWSHLGEQIGQIGITAPQVENQGFHRSEMRGDGEGYEVGGIRAYGLHLGVLAM